MILFLLYAHDVYREFSRNNILQSGEKKDRVLPYLLHDDDSYFRCLCRYESFPVFDISVGEATASKYRICDNAAETQALVFAHHFPPFPNLGYIRKIEDGWHWEPIGETIA